jgi:predicted lysophospholipase L1 biosynthesis ABC-type transport system permease subunit
MMDGNLEHDNALEARPVYMKILIFVAIIPAAYIVGYFVGHSLAGSLDFSVGEIAALLMGLAVLGWAGRDAVTRGAKAGALAMQTAIGALVGAGIVLAGFYFFEEPLKQIVMDGSLWQMAAAVVALLYTVFALILLPLGFRKTLPSGEVLTEGESKQWQRVCRWSALVSLAYAVAVGILLVGSFQTGGAMSSMIMGGVLLAMLVQVLGSWTLWKVYDELWRAATKDACAISFAIFEVVLFLWAGASLAGFNIAFDPLGLVVVLSAIYLAATFFITFKRGMDQM